MSESQPPESGPRRRVLCLLRDGPTADALRWTQTLARTHEVELADLSVTDIGYGELVDRIFAADRVISW